MLVYADTYAKLSNGFLGIRFSFVFDVLIRSIYLI